MGAFLVDAYYCACAVTSHNCINPFLQVYYRWACGIRACRPGQTMDMNTVTVYDIQNKFIAYSAPFPAVIGVFCEWGSLYVLAGDRKVWCCTAACALVLCTFSPSVLWHCWWGGRKGIRSVKSWVLVLCKIIVKSEIPQGNQELLVVKNKVGRPPGEFGVSSPWSVIFSIWMMWNLQIYRLMLLVWSTGRASGL